MFSSSDFNKTLQIGAKHPHQKTAKVSKASANVGPPLLAKGSSACPVDGGGG